MRRTLTVNEPGQRLDKFLCQSLSLSRRAALRLLEQNLVKLGGRAVSQRHKGILLNVGSVIDIDDAEAVLNGLITPEPGAALRLLAKGDGYIVADKQSGQPVMPRQIGETGTLLNAVIARYPDIQGVGEGGLRSGVVHRLDTDTSGALVVATNDKTWRSLRAAFKEHRTTKLYHALVQGQLWGEGREQMPLAVTQHRPARVSVVSPSSASRLCDLSWRALETFDQATLLEIRLGTGFLHQIRVMFAHRGHPVIGDKTYSHEGSVFGAKRQMLHAAFLNVEAIKARSPYPSDFRGVLEQLRNSDASIDSATKPKNEAG